MREMPICAHPCYPWLIKNFLPINSGKYETQRKWGPETWSPFQEINNQSLLSNDRLLLFLCLRLLAFALGELRQLGDETFRVLIERGWAVRAAEVNLLAFVFHGVFRVDRLAAH